MITLFFNDLFYYKLSLNTHQQDFSLSNIINIFSISGSLLIYYVDYIHFLIAPYQIETLNKLYSSILRSTIHKPSVVNKMNCSVSEEKQ